MKRQMMLMGMLIIATTELSLAQFYLGAKVGTISNDVQADIYIDAVNNSPKGLSTAVYGIISEYQFHENISVVSELLKSRKGFVIDESTTIDIGFADIPVGGNITTSINYVESPLLLKGIIGNEVIQAYAVAGPSLGYATSARLQPTATLLIPYNLPAIDINLSNGTYNRWDVAGVVGAGGQVKVRPGKIFADVRYQHSFSDIVSSPSIELGLKNRGLQVSAGYAYTF